jgi:hypothetical protein
MRKIFWPAVLAMPLLAGDRDFNGRWNIQVQNEARARVWWLEVSGAGGKSPQGKFVGAPGGDMDSLRDLQVKGGELRFTFERKYRFGEKALWDKPRTGVYTARHRDQRLIGTFALDGQVIYQWTGVRAPEIRDADDGGWKEGRPVELMNGRDLNAFTAMVPGQALGWEAVNGATRNVAGANNLVSKEKFWNFVVKAEYKLGAKTNGGIGLRGRYEVQILEDHGKTQDTHSHGALYSRIPPALNASRPAGEWQELEIRLVGRTLTVKLNGQTVIDRGAVEGLTAIAGNGEESQPGPFIIQGDHGAVEFRRFTVIPLVR